MKKIKTGLLVAFVLLSLQACKAHRDSHFTVQETKEYIKKHYNIKSTYLSKNDNTKENKIIYTFKANDFDDTQFQVTSEKGEGGMLGCLGGSCDYQLHDDLVESVYRTYTDQWIQEHKDASLSYDKNSNQIEIVFHDYKELIESFPKIRSHQEFLSEKMSALEYSVSSVFHFNDLHQHFPEKSFFLNDQKDFDQLGEEYINYVYDYGMEDSYIPTDLWDAQKKRNVEWHVNDDHSFKIYDQASQNLKLGKMYNLLKWWGYEVIGEPYHYTVIKENKAYVFGYDIKANADFTPFIHMNLANEIAISLNNQEINNCLFVKENNSFALKKGTSLSDIMDMAEEIKNDFKMPANLSKLTFEEASMYQPCIAIANKYRKKHELLYLFQMNEDDYAIIEGFFHDSKGKFFIKNGEKIYLKNQSSVHSKENIEQVFSIKFKYNELENRMVVESH